MGRSRRVIAGTFVFIGMSVFEGVYGRFVWRCCGSIGVFYVRSRLSFSFSGKKKWLAVCYVPVSRGRNRHSCVLIPWGASGFVGLLRRFFMAISTELRETQGYGVGGGA